MISLNEKSLKSIAYAIAQSSNISQSKVLEIFSKKIGYTNYQALRNDFSKGAEKIEHSVKTAGSWQDRMITNNKLNDHEQLAKDYNLYCLFQERGQSPEEAAEYFDKITAQIIKDLNYEVLNNRPKGLSEDPPLTSNDIKLLLGEKILEPPIGGNSFFDIAAKHFYKQAEILFDNLEKLFNELFDFDEAIRPTDKNEKKAYEAWRGSLKNSLKANIKNLLIDNSEDFKFLILYIEKCLVGQDQLDDKDDILDCLSHFKKLYLSSNKEQREATLDVLSCYIQG